MRSLDLDEKYGLVNEYCRAGDVRPAVPEVDCLTAHLCERPRRNPGLRPRTVAGFDKIVLKLIQRLRSDTGQTLPGSVAVRLEIVTEVCARAAELIVRQLAGNRRSSAEYHHIPTAARTWRTAIRHYRRQATNESFGQPIRIDIHAPDCALHQSAARPPARDYGMYQRSCTCIRSWRARCAPASGVAYVSENATQDRLAFGPWPCDLTSSTTTHSPPRMVSAGSRLHA